MLIRNFCYITFSFVIFISAAVEAYLSSTPDKIFCNKRFLAGHALPRTVCRRNVLKIATLHSAVKSATVVDKADVWLREQTL